MQIDEIQNSDSLTQNQGVIDFALTWLGKSFEYFYQNFPFFTSFSILFIFLFIAYIKFNKKINPLFLNILKFRNNDKSVDDIKLEFHPFFSSMDVAILNIFPEISLDSDVKTFLMTKFLEIRFSIFKDKLLNYVKDIELLKNKSVDELRTDVNKIFSECISESQKESIKKFESYDIKEEDIEYILKTFSKWYLRNIKLTRQNIESASTSNHVTSNIERMSEVLSILKYSFEYSIYEVSDALKEMNGRLESIKINN